MSFYRNIFLLQYHFIAILCVKMSRVNKALSKISLQTTNFFDQNLLKPNISTNTSFVNKNTYCLTLVNIITEYRMPRNTYLYENRLFRNKVRCSIREGERKKP